MMRAFDKQRFPTSKLGVFHVLNEKKQQFHTKDS